MRLIHLFALAAPLALLLPLSAQAAWPAGAKASYMADCKKGASRNTNVTEKDAEQHCACGANILEQKFTTQEIKQLMDPKTAPSADLSNRALKEISVCRVQK